MSSSFRFIPNAIQGGEATELVVEGLAEPSQVLGKKIVVDVFAKDAPLARFNAVVAKDGSRLTLQDAKRVDGHDDTLPDPDPITYKSYHTGNALEHQPFADNPTYPVAYFKLSLRGSSASPSNVRVNATKHADTHPYAYEIWAKVTQGSRVLFDGRDQPMVLDASPLLAEGCYEAARCLVSNHHEQIDREGTGTHYGSEYAKSLAPAKLQQLQNQGLDSRSCVGFLLSTLGMGHTGFGASDTWDEVKKDYNNAHSTQHWGSIASRSGVGLVKGLVERAGWSAIGVCLGPTDDAVSAALRNLRRHNDYYDMTPDNIIWQAGSQSVADKDALLAALINLNFALVIVREGIHTAILHQGDVYEVHWNRSESDKDLYDKSHRVDTWLPFGPNAGPQLLWIAVPPGLWTSAKRSEGLLP